MFASALVVALLGIVDSNSSQRPTWMTEYTNARKLVTSAEVKEVVGPTVAKKHTGWRPSAK